MITTAEASTTSKTAIKSPYQVATAVAARLPRMKNGPIAELRRMGAPFRSTTFEMFREEYSDVMAGREDDWQAIIKVIALLSNNKPKSVSIHDKDQRIGRALANGGHKQKTGKSVFLTEQRFGKLMRLPQDQRGEALVRVTRNMAQNFGTGGRINVGSFADFILFPDDKQAQRRMAMDYHNTVYHMANPKQ